MTVGVASHRERSGVALASRVQSEPARGNDMHTCRCCKRALGPNSVRDAVCLRCLYAIDRGGGWDDEDTRPGKRADVRAIDAAPTALLLQA